MSLHAMTDPIHPKQSNDDGERARIEAELVERYGMMLKTSEVADELRLSSASVRRISREDLPRGSGRGPRARYLASDVAAYISAWVKQEK
jgi:hypothetical protein